MSEPKLLDLFCCEGGASEGYRRAGFDVYGIDLFKHTNAKGKRVGFSQDRYPFQSRQADALRTLQHLLDGRPVRFNKIGHIPGRPMHALDGDAFHIGLQLKDFSAIHASPPCQHASAGTRAMRSRGESDHPALIEPTRELLEQTDLPWVVPSSIKVQQELLGIDWMTKGGMAQSLPPAYTQHIGMALMAEVARQADVA